MKNTPNFPEVLENSFTLVSREINVKQRLIAIIATAIQLANPTIYRNIPDI